LRALAGLLAALVPEQPRERLERRHGVDAAAWSAMVGVVELFGAGLTLVGDFVARIPGLVDEHTTALLEHGQDAMLRDPANAQALTLGGAWSWLVWMTQPATLLLFLLALTGIARLVVFAVTREALAEPLVWLGWHGWRLLVAGPAAAGRVRADYGPADRPDRVVPQPGGGLLVLTSRPRVEWNEHVTIQVGERFFRVADVHERQEGPWRWHAYRLREEDPGAVIRALVAYEPPGRRGGGQSPATKKASAPSPGGGVPRPG
jgi:hypothetical protein